MTTVLGPLQLYLLLEFYEKNHFLHNPNLVNIAYIKFHNLSCLLCPWFTKYVLLYGSKSFHFHINIYFIIYNYVRLYGVISNNAKQTIIECI